MIDLFVFTLAVFGAAYCIGHARISLPFRSWLAPVGTSSRWRQWAIAFLECPACVSWWAGLFAYVLHLTPPGFTWWLGPFYCCATSLILAHVTGLDDE